ncbi:MAG: DUF4388 domain-containing protein [Symploca sp. SIO1B1]|nr:DUF4388 domain-containing protein [Symploca sp. SIO1B1]
MKITTCLSECSLPEMLEFIGYIHKTGLLTIRAGPELKIRTGKIQYIWFSQGHVVAAAKRLDNQGLLRLINQQSWCSDRVTSKLAQICPQDTAVGEYLLSQGVLQAQHLQRLFSLQVLQPISTCFSLKKGRFEFETKVNLPMMEMTGVSQSTTEVTLVAQQMLRRLNKVSSRNPTRTGSYVNTALI